MDTDTIIAALRDADSLTILLDYDGTLVPIAMAPEMAAPDPPLLSLLLALASDPHTRLHIVSGRPRGTLEAWFGHLPASLWAEHGFWHRPGPRDPWEQAAPISAELLSTVHPVLEDFTARTPGSHIETKSASVAWHYRGADPEQGSRRAAELLVRLHEVVRSQPLAVLEGKKVIEVRPRGISKGLVAARIVPGGPGVNGILAIGDDHTDEDMFEALPPSSATVAVGSRPSCAMFRVADDSAVRELLHLLVAQRSTGEIALG
jgi:trehalose 6-phosphate synthase/phosphatase